MFWHHRNTNETPCGAIVDIGSGSVGIAIVVVEPDKETPTLIWSHREYTLLRTSTSLKESERLLQTTLVNAFLELSNDGIKALLEYNSDYSITEIQVSISAPWQYTSAKNVCFSDHTPFVVDEILLRDLTKLAEDQAIEQVSAVSNLSDLKLKLIAQESIGVTLDGYRVPNYSDQKASELTFVHLVSLTTQSLIESIQEYGSKIAPRAKIFIHPFMYNFYKMVDTMYPHTLEACLIDITNEATEIAIIRDGTIRQVTHVTIGSFTLARKIAEVLVIPVEEAYTYLKSGTEYGIASLSEKVKEKIEPIFSSYETELVTLFKSTGDELLLPYSIFVHTDMNTQHFFNNAIKKAAKSTTNTEHVIHPVTAKLISDSHEGDTAILLNVQRFYQMHEEIHSA